MRNPEHETLYKISFAVILKLPKLKGRRFPCDPGVQVLCSKDAESVQ